MKKRSHKALLVVDMINEYVSTEGLLFCPSARTIITNIRYLIGLAREKSWPVIFVNTVLTDPTSPMALKWGMHAVKGTWGAGVIPELHPNAGDRIIDKETYDGFFETDLERVLRELQIETVVVVGIHTHVCVLLTALGAFYRGFKVILIEEGMTTDKLVKHENSLPFFTSHVGQLMKLDEFIRSFSC